MTDVTFRRFSWADVPAIARIYSHYVTSTTVTFDTDVPPDTAMAEKFGHMLELGHPILIAEDHGAVVGYAYASMYRPRAAYRFTCEDSIYLAPEMVGRGIGGRMLAALIEDSRAFGFKQMIAVITSEGANSIRLHEKHGFAHIGRHPQLGYKFDRWLDVVHMQRTL